MGERFANGLDKGSVLVCREVLESIDDCLWPKLLSSKPESTRCGAESVDGIFTVGVKEEKLVREVVTGSPDLVENPGGSTVELARALRLFRSLKAWRASVADTAEEELAKGSA